VSKASSSWQQLSNQLPKWSLPQTKTGARKQQLLRRFQGPGGFLGLLSIVVAIMLWDWKLLLALLVGLVAMVLVYSMQKWDWQSHWSDVRRTFNQPHRRLLLAVVSGLVAVFSTYLATEIWVDSTSSWIATGTIVQGLATLLTLVLLVWQIVSFYGYQEEDQIDELLVNLTEKDPLKRLIAVRQLTKLVNRKRVDSHFRHNVGEYLQMLLRFEKETTIREAAFEGLQVLDVQPLTSKNNTSVPLAPISAKAKELIDNL
jgi:uncharacterized protein YggT (Ycf19 family)